MFRIFGVVSTLSLLTLSACCDPMDIECINERHGIETHNSADDGTAADPNVGGGVDLLTIDLPFRGGYDSLCTQGANGDYSHHSRSTMYDVDLDTPNDVNDPVFAPVGGIAYAHDENPNKNYGNHVTIDQGDGTYVILAHLKQILIGDGEEVAAGELVGIEGHTGSAQGDHVHIGRHSGDATKMGEYGTSVNALAFTAYDTNTRQNVTKMTTELTCSLETGHTYESQLGTPLWHPSGSLIKTPDSATVYLQEAGTVYPFLTEGVFTSRNYSWNDIVTVDPNELSCYIMGSSISSTGLVTAVYDDIARTGGWLIVGTASDSGRYRKQIVSNSVNAVLSTWGISASSVSALPKLSTSGIDLDDYPRDLDNVTFRDGSLVSTNEQSDVYVMQGGVGLPIVDWDTYLLMGFGNRTVVEVPKADFDVLVLSTGSCATDSYCIANADVTTCGGDTEDVPGTYPGEGTGGTDTEDDPQFDARADEMTGVGLELWWWLGSEAEWISISGEFTNESHYAYGWNSDITWVTNSDEMYFSIPDMSSGDSFRYSYAFSQNGVENWSCLGPYPPGLLTGTPYATYNGTPVDVAMADDPSSDGCGLQVSIP